MDLLLLGCQLSKFSVNWKICFLQIAIACPNSSRFTLYLFLNKLSHQSPQSLWSFSCINNVIDLLFEPLSLSLSLFAKWFTTIKFSVILCAPILIPDSLKKKKKARIGLELFCALDSSLRAFQMHFKFILGTLSNVCSTLNWLPSTSSNF